MICLKRMYCQLSVHTGIKSVHTLMLGGILKKTDNRTYVKISQQNIIFLDKYAFIRILSLYLRD
jgi:hypothetical protein